MVVEDVDEEVESSSVGHAKYYVLVADLAGELEEFLQGHDGALGSLSGVPLEGVPFLMDEVVEGFSLD